MPPVSGFHTAGADKGKAGARGRERAGEVRGRPGWLCELGRKGGGGPLRKIKMIFFLFLK